MKISKEELEHTFSQKVIGKGAANEAGFKVLTTADCIVRKEVLTKCLYESLFYWFVHRQKDLEVIDPKGQYETIGILDISGFEMLSTNSLEQLLINYMNERAQKMFTSSYFDEEKALFEKEGLSKYILDFRPSSNEEVMRVIDNPKGQHKGAFQALEDALKSFRGDASFLVNLVEAQKNSPLFSKSLKKNDRFTIYHSCYPVEYTVKDFVEKIKDELPSNLLALMSKSNPIVGKILEETLKLALDNNKMINLCESFKRGINELMEDLEKSRCNFVRCIKPNNSKAAGVWDMPLVMNQIKFLGIKDFLIMKKKMFPLRIDYKEFCKKYLEINTSVNEMYYELEAKPYTNFKEIALE
jgi:myosin heavy subunit